MKVSDYSKSFFFVEQKCQYLLKHNNECCAVFLPGVDGAAGGQGPAHGVGAEGDDEEEDVALPVRRLAAQQLNVGPEHRVEEGVGAAEPDLNRK